MKRHLLWQLATLYLTGGLLAAQRPVSEIAADLGRYAAEQRGTAPPAAIVVPSGGDLQSALNKGGVIQLEPQGVYIGAFVARVPGTRLHGAAGAKLIGSKSPALVVPPGTRDIYIENIEATAPAYDQAVIRLGANDRSQTTPEQEPSDIHLTNVRVPTHRGKRAFEINARGVTMVNCSADDVWDPAGRDSQGIVVLNSSGSLRVTGGTFVAGSENIMVGGDTIKLAGIQTRDLVFEGVTLTKPSSWRTDGVNRGVKNLFELKAGINVTLRNFTLSGSWRAGQTGEGIVITPMDRRVVDHVLIEDGTITDVASGMQILGRDYKSFTDGALHLTMRRVRMTTQRAWGGQGRVATISAEPASLTFEDNTFRHDGDSILYVYVGTVMEADGTQRKSGPIGSLTFAGNRTLRPVHGLFLNGYSNGGPKGEGLSAATTLAVTGNTFGGDASASIAKLNFPTNTYLTRAAFDAAHPWQ